MAEPSHDPSFLEAARATFAATLQYAAKHSITDIAREAVKDVRNTNHELWFGQPERSGEPGAPLNPLHSEIAAGHEGSVYGDAVTQTTVQTPAEIARGGQEAGSVHGQDVRDAGQVMEQRGGKPVIGYWTGEYDRRAQEKPGDYEPAEERSKPREEQEQKEREEKEHENEGRGGRCS